MAWVGLFGVPAIAPARHLAPAAVARAGYRAGLDALDARLGALDTAVAVAGPSDTTAVRQAFRQARAAYKRIEFLVEYVDSTGAAALNGPSAQGAEGPATEHVGDPLENDNDQSIGALQAVEQGLYRFPVLFVSTRGTVRAAVAGARATMAALRASAPTIDLSDAAVFDAARLEIARVLALGLAGDDSRLARNGLSEAAAALAGVRGILAVYGDVLEARSPGSWHALDARFARAVAALSAGRDFDTFDRLRFIGADANPLAEALARAARVVGAASGRPSLAGAVRPWRREAATLFEVGAFDALAYAPPHTPRPTAAQVALGAALFADPALSGSGTRSCATCHQPARMFTDGRQRAAPLRARAVLRHTPTLLNVALQDALFADGRAGSLEEQVVDVVRNPNEMAGTLDLAARRLATHPETAVLFARAFPRAGSAPVTPNHIRVAIAAYERTLVALNTRVDRALQGDTAALDGPEQHGFTVFMGKGRCGTCHYLPLFRGMRPPTYAHGDVEVLGVPSHADTAGAVPDPDSGRAAITHTAADDGAMRTPGLRFVAHTGPYMHNGVYRTLAQVIDFYDRGGGLGIGARRANQTLAPTPLHLTAEEKHDLRAFLEALSDSTSPTRH